MWIGALFLRLDARRAAVLALVCLVATLVAPVYWNVAYPPPESFTGIARFLVGGCTGMVNTAGFALALVTRGYWHGAWLIVVPVAYWAWFLFT